MNFQEPGAQAPRGIHRWARRVACWLHRRRRIAALSALRGASYAAGTNVVALIAWWIKTRY